MPEEKLVKEQVMNDSEKRFNAQQARIKSEQRKTLRLGLACQFLSARLSVPSQKIYEVEDNKKALFDESELEACFDLADIMLDLNEEREAECKKS